MEQPHILCRLDTFYCSIQNTLISPEDTEFDIKKAVGLWALLTFWVKSNMPVLRNDNTGFFYKQNWIFTVWWKWNLLLITLIICFSESISKFVNEGNTG